MTTSVTFSMPHTAESLRRDVIVCMLFFNKAEQTIESARSFVEAGLKIHLLDNGSAPESLAILKAHFGSHPSVRIQDAGANRGVSGGRNLQIAATSEPWMLFVDNDITTSGQGWLECMARSMNEFPDAEIFVPRLFNKHENDWNGLSDFVIDRFGNCAFVRAEGQFANAFPGGSALVSRSVYERLGAYDEDLFVGFEDFELAIRAWKCGRPLLVRGVEDVVFIHDHRVSGVQSDKVAAMVRYDVGHIGKSHAVVRDKHGVLLDPNFAQWLRDQVQHLTGSGVGEAGESQPEENKYTHALIGTTTVPRYCLPLRFVVLVNGQGDDLWFRLRALRLAIEKAGAAGLKAYVRVLGGAPALLEQALAAGMADECIDDAACRHNPAIFEANGADAVVWLGCGLISSEFLVQSAQGLSFAGDLRRAVVHPERLLFAPPGGLGVQYVREGWFDPLDVEHASVFFPAFVVQGMVWSKAAVFRAERADKSVVGAVLAWLIRVSQGDTKHYGLPGSAAIIKKDS